MPDRLSLYGVVQQEQERLVQCFSDEVQPFLRDTESLNPQSRFISDRLQDLFESSLLRGQIIQVELRGGATEEPEVVATDVFGEAIATTLSGPIIGTFEGLYTTTAVGDEPAAGFGLGLYVRPLAVPMDIDLDEETLCFEVPLEQVELLSFPTPDNPLQPDAIDFNVAQAVLSELYLDGAISREQLIECVREGVRRIGECSLVRDRAIELWVKDGAQDIITLYDGEIVELPRLRRLAGQMIELVLDEASIELGLAALRVRMQLDGKEAEIVEVSYPNIVDGVIVGERLAYELDQGVFDHVRTYFNDSLEQFFALGQEAVHDPAQVVAFAQGLVNDLNEGAFFMGTQRGMVRTVRNGREINLSPKLTIQIDRESDLQLGTYDQEEPLLVLGGTEGPQQVLTPGAYFRLHGQVLGFIVDSYLHEAASPALDDFQLMAVVKPSAGDIFEHFDAGAVLVPVDSIISSRLHEDHYN